MESQSEQILLRLRRVFDCFLQPNFVNQSNVYFEKLLSHLAAKENAYVLHEPVVIEWVNNCIDAAQNDFKSVHPKVITFMLKFASLLASNEWTIIMIREHKIMDRVLRIVKEHIHEFNPSIKFGTIRLLSAIAQNSLGLAYIRAAHGWRCLIDYCNNDHTLYVVREARQLLYDLLYKFSVKTKDETLVVEMLGEILKPLLENVYEEHNGSIHITVEDGELQHKLSATLDLISFILQKTIEAEDKNNLIHLCIVHYDIELCTWKICETGKNPYFMGKILTAITSINFSRLVYEKWESGEIAPENFNTFGLCFFNTMKMCISTGDSMNFLKLAELNHRLWKRLGPRAPKEIVIENDRVRFENQLITFHVIPLLFILKSKDIQQEELFDEFIMKLIHNICEQSHRICYGFRDVLFSTEQLSPSLVCDLACKSVHSILSMENKLDRDQAVVVFQSMIYALKELTLKTSDDDIATTASGTTCPLEQLHKVLFSVLIGLQTLIERYRITWKESIETICLVNCVGWLLENSNLNPRLAVQALKLMQLSIEHFLSPNMALLVNNLQGSGLVRLGPIIVKLVHNNAWEVRDSTLELVTSIAEISRCKFPAFQQFLAEHNICPIVYQMAQNDGEPYVRATAFKCLTNFVAINLIWENELKKLDIIEHLFSVLYNESEGIVRKEAVTTLAKIYDQRKIPLQMTDIFYSTLTHCTVADLHWEVKVNALRFWELEIQRQFTHQGMIDGTFPTVTFSKEHKKIVTLTEKEINLRIIKAFNELSHRGCLGVVLNCLKEDCDLEVVKTAVCIVHGLFEILKKYNYESALGNATTPDATTSSATNEDDGDYKDIKPVVDQDVTTSNLESSDAIIEKILDEQDINLLVHACEKQLDLNGDTNHRHINESFYRQYAKVTTTDFITNVKDIDFEKLLKKHQEWHLSDQSFISLLDDIVCLCNPDDVEIIFADCY